MLVSLALVAGCASNYIDPSLDETASVPTARWVLKTRDGLTRFRAFADSARCAKPQAIAGAMLQAGADDQIDIGVVADRDFSFAAQQVVGDGKGGCQTLATFRPAAGHRYLATFTRDGEACALIVTRILSAVPPRIAAEPTYRARRPAAVSGASCAAE